MNNKRKPEFILQLEEAIDSVLQDGQEPLLLSRLTQSIEELSIDDINPFDKYRQASGSSEVIDKEINDLWCYRVTAEMLLLRSWTTYKRKKYQLIFQSTVNAMKWSLLKSDYHQIIENAEDINQYFEDALETSPDDFDTIALICEVYYLHLGALLELGEPTDEIINTIDNTYLPFLVVAANKDKHKFHAALLIGQIGDALLCRDRFVESCGYYSQFMDLISEITMLSVSQEQDFAPFLGHYSIALLQSENRDSQLVESVLEKECSVFEKLHDNCHDIRNTMNLAIAYSHKGAFYEGLENFSSAIECHLKKVKLIIDTFDISEDNPIYSEEARVDSLINSLQFIMHYGLVADISDRVRFFKMAFEQLNDLLGNFTDDRLWGYLNAFALELYKVTAGYDDSEAEYYIFRRLIVLLSFLKHRGAEKDIVADLYQTLIDGRPFVERTWERLKEPNRVAWEIAADMFSDEDG